ncbi:MAG: hypothetical protein A3B70_07830 [Deltaproteobacteria bacterium RIFCSPHIGHO2_02_FULL_40_11]|nr:MAG: hypothetical protein A3B70_07830 [Deltaproteobacteria bacterium RIFCSPHIGHO2_02_FULL_40_11]
MKNRKILVLFSAFTLIFLFFISVKLYKKYEIKRLGFLAKENFSTFVRNYSPKLGSDHAKIYLIEFLDPECESCRDFYPYIKQLMSEHEGKIKLVVRYAPLHENSKFAVKILEASRNQNKYWETLELLFRYQPIWGSHHNPRPDLIWAYLPEIGVDVEKIKKDMNSSQIELLIEQDINDANELGVKKTPTFFVNGTPLKQFGFQYLQDAIEYELRD